MIQKSGIGMPIRNMIQCPRLSDRIPRNRNRSTYKIPNPAIPPAEIATGVNMASSSSPLSSTLGPSSLPRDAQRDMTTTRTVEAGAGSVVEATGTPRASARTLRKGSFVRVRSRALREPRDSPRPVDTRSSAPGYRGSSFSALFGRAPAGRACVRVSDGDCRSARRRPARPGRARRRGKDGVRSG